MTRSDAWVFDVGRLGLIPLQYRNAWHNARYLLIRNIEYLTFNF